MKRSKFNSINIWPGFVDAISTLLLVFVFLLAVLMISENFLTQAIFGKNTALDNLRSRIKSLELNIEEGTEENIKLSKLLKNLNIKLEKLIIEKENTDKNLIEEKKNNENLSLDLEGLEKKILGLLDELGIEKLKITEKENINRELNSTVAQLNDNIISLNKKIKTVQNMLETSNKDINNKNLEIENLSEKLNQVLEQKVGELEEYRSEFFGRLKKIIGDEEEINIVGDRFVLQSEVFFSSGSAEIGKEGKEKVIEITKVLLSISKKIPNSLDWLIQVEGHTDNIPISTVEFPSNWELSTARAISVAKIMMKNGIPSNKINVAGYGEHKPLVKNNDSFNREKNRRIELKLTQP